MKCLRHLTILSGYSNNTLIIKKAVFKPPFFNFALDIFPYYHEKENCSYTAVYTAAFVLYLFFISQA